MCSMCLTAKKQSILDLWVGFFFFSQKGRWLFSVHDTFDLEAVFYSVILAIEAILGGKKLGIFQ